MMLAMNICPTECSVIKVCSSNAMDGGIMMPGVPPAASVPAAKEGT